MTKDRFDLILDGLDFERLTEWEEEFVESLEEQMKSRGQLTQKQEDCLEKIYRNKAR